MDRLPFCKQAGGSNQTKPQICCKGAFATPAPVQNLTPQGKEKSVRSTVVPPGWSAQGSVGTVVFILRVRACLAKAPTLVNDKRPATILTGRRINFANRQRIGTLQSFAPFNVDFVFKADALTQLWRRKTHQGPNFDRSVRLILSGVVRRRYTSPYEITMGTHCSSCLSMFLFCCCSLSWMLP